MKFKYSHCLSHCLFYVVKILFKIFDGVIRLEFGKSLFEFNTQKTEFQISNKFWLTKHELVEVSLNFTLTIRTSSFELFYQNPTMFSLALI